MHLNPDPDATELLATVIHEGIHACFFDLEEAAVIEAEGDIVRLLRRMGIQVTFEPKS